MNFLCLCIITVKHNIFHVHMKYKWHFLNSNFWVQFELLNPESFFFYRKPSSINKVNSPQKRVNSESSSRLWADRVDLQRSAVPVWRENSPKHTRARTLSKNQATESSWAEPRSIWARNPEQTCRGAEATGGQTWRPADLQVGWWNCEWGRQSTQEAAAQEVAAFLPSKIFYFRLLINTPPYTHTHTLKDGSDKDEIKWKLMIIIYNNKTWEN